LFYWLGVRVSVGYSFSLFDMKTRLQRQAEAAREGGGVPPRRFDAEV